nr:Hpt domain-containing protein [bacterium]
MGINEDDFLKELLETFKIEAGEHLKAMTSGLLELEKTPAGEQTEIIETVFRAAHSLKGAARAVNLTDVELICQSLESVFSALKQEAISFSSELFDILYHTIDTVDVLVASPEKIQSIQISEIVRQLDLQKAGEFKRVISPQFRQDIPPEDVASRSQEVVLQHPPEVRSSKG